MTITKLAADVQGALKILNPELKALDETRIQYQPVHDSSSEGVREPDPAPAIFERYRP